MAGMELSAPKFFCLPDCFQHLEAVAVALIEADGRLVKGNAGFLRLVGECETPTCNVADFFVQPRWHTLVATHVPENQPLYVGVLNIGDPNGVCHSLLGMVQRRDEQLLFVGEHDIRELEALNTQVVQLNEQMAEMQRDLARSNRQLKASEARFKNLSVTDPLTGLANRRHLEELLNGEIERSQRYGEVFSLIMADIDHFKHVNDTYGHDIGDSVLRVFAGLLREQVRDCDLVARLGGEEFVVLLPRTDLASATASAERLRVATRQMHASGFPERLSASFGVTHFGPGDTLHSLLKRVDEGLYAAKTRGRDRVVSLESGNSPAESGTPDQIQTGPNPGIRSEG